MHVNRSQQNSYNNKLSKFLEVEKGWTQICHTLVQSSSVSMFALKQVIGTINCGLCVCNSSKVTQREFLITLKLKFSNVVKKSFTTLNWIALFP